MAEDDGAPRVSHIDRALPTNGHRPMYNAHKYFARKQADVVSAYVERYTRPDEVVLDPFCGSGVHVAEAVASGRRAVGFDVNPFSVFLARNTVRPVDPERVEAAFRRVEADVRSEIAALYRTTCRDCGAELSAICYAWEGEELADVRYDCECRDDRSIEPVTEADRARYRRVAAGEAEAFFDGDGECRYAYPTDDLSYPDGAPFLERQGYESVDDLFTDRNLVALARLRARVDEVGDDALRGALRSAFTSMLHLASTMTPVRPSRPFSSAWTQHSYWSAETFMEQNVWTLFERAVVGRQGLVNAKRDQPEAFADAREAGSVADLLGGRGDYRLRATDAVAALSAMPDDSVDYVLTDPPYGGSVQYGELLYMWGAWLGLTDGFADVSRNEIVVNDRQGKDDAAYERLLAEAFAGVYDVLKPGRHCTVTFHNPRLKYRTALLRAALGAGFAFENVVYQPPPRPSAKGLLQPFGSLKGDYFFRFRKPTDPLRADRAERTAVSRERVERTVVETAADIVAERGEPTHYTFVQNAIDPELYSQLREHGLLMEFDPADVEEVLREHLGEEFRLVETRVGERRGEAVTERGWWLTDPRGRGVRTPLRKRVEETVIRLLRRERTVAFDAVLDAVYAEFADSLTPEVRTVEDALSANATETGRKTWRADPVVDRVAGWNAEARSDLRVAGAAAGYDVDPTGESDGDGDERVHRPDAVWRDGAEPVATFCVEHTTCAVDSVVRCADLSDSVPRFVVVPAPRADALARRFDGPAVREMAAGAEWRVVTGDAAARAAASASPLDTLCSRSCVVSAPVDADGSGEPEER